MVVELHESARGGAGLVVDAVECGVGQVPAVVVRLDLRVVDEDDIDDLEPGNTTYRRDLSVSFERLADLARATGQTDQALA